MPDNRPEIVHFSFWKPEPIPPKDSGILPIELHSLGSLNAVAEKLLDVPHMTQIPPNPWEHIEQGPPKPGEVLTINARSSAPEKAFYRLYVQIFEQFGATLLDEQVHQFFTPKEFRTKLAG